MGPRSQTRCVGLRWGLWAPPIVVAAALTLPSLVHAAPGDATRMAGAEPQGPASASVTGLHHNPAMLARMPGFRFESTMSGGLDHQIIRRQNIAGDGSPEGELRPASQVINPAWGYFVGASFLLDPIAIGAGVYTREGRERVSAGEEFRYHLAGDPDFGCAFDSNANCPDLRRGGFRERQTDVTVALAWAPLPRFQIGASVHFPFLNVGVAQDVDAALSAAGEGTACDLGEGQTNVESPDCAERFSFRGGTRLRLFGLNQNPSTRADFIVTLGIAAQVHDRITIGGRYRTQPLLGQGSVVLNGEAVLCLEEEAAKAGFSDIVPCTTAGGIEATIEQRLPREAAVGASFELGADRRWTLDSNFYWVDRCPGFERGGGCNGNDSQRLSLVGLERGTALLPETTLYRGYADVWGLELWGRYDVASAIGGRPGVRFCDGSERGKSRCTPRVDVLTGAGFASPGVRPSAMTAARSDGWRVSATLGAAFMIPPRRNRFGAWHLVPGYGVDFSVPTRVGADGATPAFDPVAALQFQQSGGDLNGEGAGAVLDGRATPTNAGLYTGLIHTFTLGVRWSER